MRLPLYPSAAARTLTRHPHPRTRPPISPLLLQLSVQGMHCSSCSTAVERALSTLPGVLSADVALLAESADIRLDTSRSAGSTSAADVVAAVEACGFDARIVSSTQEELPLGSSRGQSGAQALRLSVTGMHCGACSSGARPAMPCCAGCWLSACSCWEAAERC